MLEPGVSTEEMIALPNLCVTYLAGRTIDDIPSPAI